MSGHRSPRARWAAPLALLAATLFLVQVVAAAGGSAPRPDSPDFPGIWGGGGSSPAGYVVGDRASGVPAGSKPQSGTLSVAKTTNLLDSVQVNGNLLPPTVLDPTVGVVDPGRGALFVADSGGALAAVNLSENAVDLVAPVGATPTAVVLDAADHKLFVANNGSNNVSILDEVSLSPIASVAVGGGPSAAVFDSRNSTLFVANSRTSNVSVISVSTSRVVATVTVGLVPDLVAYDSLTDRVFVGNALSGSVTVINATSYARVTTDLLGGAPSALLVNPVDNVVDVANGSGANVTVLGALDGARLAMLPTGTEPTSLALDPGTDLLYVGNQYTINITVVNQSLEKVVATIPLISTPHGLAYDPTNHDLYVAQPGAARVTAIDTTNYSHTTVIFTAGAIETNNAVFLEVDNTTGKVYSVNRAETWSAYTDNITVIDPSTNLPTASIPLSVSVGAMALDPVTHEVFVTIPNAGSVDVFNESTGAVLARIWVGLQPVAVVFDSWNGEVYVAEHGGGNLSIIDPVSLSVQRILSLGGLPVALAFDSLRGYIYVADESSGSVLEVNGTTGAVDARFVTGALHLVALAFDPVTQRLYAADEAAGNLLVLDPSFQVTLDTVAVGGSPGAVVYDPMTGSIEVAPTLGGEVSIIDPRNDSFVTNVTVVAGPDLLPDPVLGGVLTAVPATNQVNGFLEAGFSLLPGLDVGNGSGALLLDPTSGNVYVANAGSGTVTQLIPTPTASLYPVEFAESGLPAGTPWNVAVNGVFEATSGRTLTFFEPNGTASYDVVPPAGNISTPANGTAAVRGAAVLIPVQFAPIPLPVFPIAFAESGLPAGTPWGVTLAGVDLVAVAPSVVETNETNGVYSYSVDPISSYSPQPPSGVVTVSGQGVSYTIRWTGPPPPPSNLTASLNLSASNISLGASVAITARATGGQPPYAFTYLALPSGCSAGNVTSFACTPNTTGAWHLSVRVDDHAGHHAFAGAALTVTLVPGPLAQGSPPTPTFLSTYWWVLLLAAAAVAIGIGVWLSRRPKRPTGSHGVGAEASPPESSGDPESETPSDPEPTSDEVGTIPELSE